MAKTTMAFKSAPFHGDRSRPHSIRPVDRDRQSRKIDPVGSVTGFLNRFCSGGASSISCSSNFQLPSLLTLPGRMSGAGNEDLFFSVVAEIKAYQGKDPLCPWLRGIRRMQGSLPRKTLAEKLPRFLQRCAEKFESDPRYRNDIRYLRIWFQLMDHVDDPRGLLRRMEKNQIGVEHSAFYVAFSMSYEKQKKYEEAEQMYHLGAQRLAAPISELQKSYDQFLHRLKHYMSRKSKIQEANNDPPKFLSLENNGQNSSHVLKIESQRDNQIVDHSHEEPKKSNVDRVKPGFITNEDTVVFKFVGSAVVGKSTAEDACHHGLVDPTVNMKEAMSDINSMFRQPLDVDTRSKRRIQQNSRGFEIFEDSPPESNPSGQRKFDFFVDKEPANDDDGDDDDDDDDDDGSVVCQFVGSTVAGNRAVENACHSGLVDPTVNMKEAIDEINGMFGKPIDFVRAGRQRRERCPTVGKQMPCQQGFAILADDDVDEEDESDPSAGGSRDSGLFEPTVFTKEAMSDINDMFSKPLKF